MSSYLFFKPGTRSEPRGPRLKIAVDLVDEDLIDEGTALMRVDPEQISQLLHPQLDPKAEKTLLAPDLNASPRCRHRRARDRPR